MPRSPTITQAVPLRGSRVVALTFSDGLRGSADLRDLVSAATFECFETVDGGEALRWPDGSYLLAEGLRSRVLAPPRREPPMSAAVMARWADDGLDVRWELVDGTPVSRPVPSERRARTVAEIGFLVAGHCRPTGRHRVLLHAWVGHRPESRDLRIADIILMPLRRFGGHVSWVDDAVCLVEISEPATAWADEQRLTAFRRLPSVQEILLMDAGCAWARIDRRTGAGWRTRRVGADGALTLSCIGWSVPLWELARGTG